jgi:hypothetical protein
MTRGLLILLALVTLATTTAQAGDCCPQTGQRAAVATDAEGLDIPAGQRRSPLELPAFKAENEPISCPCCPDDGSLGRCQCCAGGTGVVVDSLHRLCWGQWWLPLQERPGWRPLTRGLEPAIPPPSQT